MEDRSYHILVGGRYVPTEYGLFLFLRVKYLTGTCGKARNQKTALVSKSVTCSGVQAGRLLTANNC
jgi:hypothetical protein